MTPVSTVCQQTRGAPRRTIGAAGRDRLRELCLCTDEHYVDGPGHVRNVEVAVRVRSPPQKSWSSAHQRAVLLERYVSCPSVPHDCGSRRSVVARELLRVVRSARLCVAPFPGAFVPVACHHAHVRQGRLGNYPLAAMFLSMTASVSCSSLVGLNSMTSVPAYR